VRQEHLGQTVLRVYQHNSKIQDPYIRSLIGATLTTGQAIDFAARLRGYGTALTPELATRFARFTGIDPTYLRLIILPHLQSAGVISYRVEGNNLTFIEEYVGVASPLLDQVIRVFELQDPDATERCVLSSAHLVGHAPFRWN